MPPELARAEPLPEQPPVPGPAVATYAGEVVGERHLRVIPFEEAPMSVLTTHQVKVVDLLSQGLSRNQIARRLDVHPTNVHRSLELSSEKLETPPSANTIVNEAIRRGEFAVEVTPDQEISATLTPMDIKVLKFYAKGGTNTALAKESGVDARLINKYSDELFKKIKAWSPAHSIRRAYELGILTV